MQSPAQERRRYFRTQQDIIFDFKPVDVHTAEHSAPEQSIGGDTSMQLLSDLRRIDKELQTTGKVLTGKQRLLGDYLNKLNSKIDLIARHSIFAARPENQTVQVSIGEGGIAFECDRALYKGNFLVLQIIFLRGYTPVIVFAQVTRCDAKKGKYLIAAAFHRLRDHDRQELAKQVLKAQISERRLVTDPENKI